MNFPIRALKNVLKPENARVFHLFDLR